MCCRCSEPAPIGGQPIRQAQGRRSASETQTTEGRRREPVDFGEHGAARLDVDLRECAGCECQQQQKQCGSFHGRVGDSSAKVGARYLDPRGAAMLNSYAFGVMGESWMVAVAQPGRAPDCGSGCRGFKSRRSPHPSAGLTYPDAGGLAGVPPEKKSRQTVMDRVPCGNGSSG
jgi:hypothetical protein